MAYMQFTSSIAIRQKKGPGSTPASQSPSKNGTKNEAEFMTACRYSLGTLRY